MKEYMPPADECAIFCETCSSAFVILKRKTTEDDFYMCTMCRDNYRTNTWKDFDKENSYKSNEVDDYWNY